MGSPLAIPASSRRLCARGGCTAASAGKYCTRRCAAVARMCAGWQPWQHLLRPEVRAIACRKGALSTAKAMRRARAKAITAQLAPLLGHRVFQDLDHEQKAAVLVLLGKAFRSGRQAGYQQGYRAKDTPHLKRKRVA